MTNENNPAVGAGGRSHLGAGSRITGELFFPGTVELPGHVNGRVEANAIVVEETGEVEGDLHAASIIIKGRFNGRISGGKVMLHTSAKVTGEITYEILSIESGARVEGKCMSRPYAKDAKPVERQSAAAGQ